jgi:hypothetical protein
MHASTCIACICGDLIDLELAAGRPLCVVPTAQCMVWIWPASGTVLWAVAAVLSIHCMRVGLSIVSLCSLAVHSSTHSSAHDRPRSTGDGHEREGL